MTFYVDIHAGWFFAGWCGCVCLAASSGVVGLFCLTGCLLGWVFCQAIFLVVVGFESLLISLCIDWRLFGVGFLWRV